MSSFLKLIRINNLLIIVLTQFLIRYALLEPMLNAAQYELQLSTFNFIILVLSTVLLTAAGYVINDYFDTKTDMLNRPDKVIVGKTIHRRMAMIIHFVLSILGVALGFYVSWQINLLKLGYIFIIITGILWFYSTDFKRNFLIGNIIVAVLTGLVPLMPVLYEIPPLNIHYQEALLLLKYNFNSLFFWSLGFASFAFITTLTREIIKDVEDFEGDAAYGRKSLPIVVGVKNTKIIVISLISITIFAIIYLSFRYIFINFDNSGKFISLNIPAIIYIPTLLVLPNLYLIFKIIKAQNNIHWHFASVLSKIIMLFGILFTLIILYQLN